jgi:hypothetical protein
MRRLLWIDCGGGALVGMLVLLLRPWLSALYGLPEHSVWLMGVMNLAYASYSFCLALAPRRPLTLLAVLVLANLAWTMVCVRGVLLHRATLTPFGWLHLLGEGTYVAVLAALEWRWREALARR